MEFRKKKSGTSSNARKKQSSSSATVTRRLDFNSQDDVETFSSFTANLRHEGTSASLLNLPSSSTSLTSSRPANFYGNSRITTTRRDTAWGPREPLPIRTSSPVLISGRSPDLSFHGRSSRHDTPSRTDFNPTSIMELIQSSHSSIEKKLASVDKSLESITSRLDQFEERQTALETMIQGTGLPQSSTKSPTAKVVPGMKRKRQIPSALQCKIRRIHSAFDEDKQLHVSEPINSSHNSKVVDSIVEAVGEEFSEDLIRRGCTTHRKTLYEKTKKTSTPIKKAKQIRSRKQRSYERRAKQVKSRELSLWKDVTADMMSDEEKDLDSGHFIRHQPSYRSEKLNTFLTKLDARFDKQSHQQPRTKRIIGSPVSRPIPKNAKSWLVVDSNLGQNGAGNENKTSQTSGDNPTNDIEDSNSDQGSSDESDNDSEIY